MTRVSARQTIVTEKKNRHNQLVAFVSILLHEPFKTSPSIFFLETMQHQTVRLSDVNVE
jgi:hypothetical protein